MNQPEPVQPVQIVTQSPGVEVAQPLLPSSFDVPWALVAGVIIVLVVVCAAVMYLRWRVQAAPAERAFAAMSWRFGLRSTDRAAVRMLAQKIGGVQPVALLMAPGALAAALDAHSGEITAASASRLRARVANAP